MLNVMHFGRISANIVSVHQLFLLIDDGHLWMQNKIPIRLTGLRTTHAKYTCVTYCELGMREKNAHRDAYFRMI